MDIELYLILSTTYSYMLAHDREPENTQQSYVKTGIETYFRKHGYTYDESQKEWTTQARVDEVQESKRRRR